MKKSIMICILLTLLFLSLSKLVIGEDERIPVYLPLNITTKTTSIIGTPQSRVDSNESTTQRRELGETEAKEALLNITQIDGKFYWASRGNKELYHHVSGAFNYFYSDDGSGYIKCVTIDGKAYYIENVHQFLSTITYWGKLELYE